MIQLSKLRSLMVGKVGLPPLFGCVCNQERGQARLPDPEAANLLATCQSERLSINKINRIL